MRKEHKINIQKTTVNRKDRLIAVYMKDGKLVGTCIVDYHTKTPLLYNLFVNPECRTEGIATSLIDGVMAKCKRNFKKNLCINVEEDNEAILLYKKLGFDIVFDYPDSEEVMMAINFQEETKCQDIEEK